MPSITSWTRLEPQSRRADLRDSLAARLHDPLWQLSRQWQIGEFTAEDAASPVSVRVRVEHAAMSRYRPGVEGPGIPLDAGRTPLETLVEAEPVLTGEPNARLAATAGAHFLRLLEHHGATAYRDDYVARYPLRPADGDASVDAAARRFFAVVARGLPDGATLHADLAAALAEPNGQLPDEPTVADADAAAVSAAAREWLEWYATFADEPAGGEPPASAWLPERLEYEFAIGAPAATGETVLVAPEYTSGRLDWAAFDRQPGGVLGAAQDRDQLRTVTRTVIPTPVTFRGMPAARWWEFEEAEVDFGEVEAGPSDLLRLLLVGFAVDYGNDWFVAPVELDVGAVCAVRSLVVTDSFGQRTLVRRYGEVDAPRRDWRMFCPTTPGSASAAGDGTELLALCPTLAAGLQGEPVEEVLFLRDELANLGWAVERMVESAAGGRLDRLEAYQAARESPTESAVAADGDDSLLHYRFTTAVPDYWVPLLPVRPDPQRPDIRLRRGRLLRDRGGEPVAPAALGRILEPDHPLDLFEEEVPRAGARVTRAYQYARGSDGRAHLWVGRNKRSGRGEGWSGLRFDVIEPLP